MPRVMIDLNHFLQDPQERAAFITTFQDLDRLQGELLALLPANLAKSRPTGVDSANEDEIRRIVKLMDGLVSQLVSRLSLSRLPGQDLARDALSYLSVKRYDEERRPRRVS